MKPSWAGQMRWAQHHAGSSWLLLQRRPWSQAASHWPSPPLRTHAVWWEVEPSVLLPPHLPNTKEKCSLWELLNLGMYSWTMTRALESNLQTHKS